VINGIVDVYGNKEVRNSTINHKFYADPETYIYDVILGKNGQFIGNVIGEPLDPSIKIDVNNLEELTNTMNIATNDIENEYTINLNEGTYTGTTQTWNEGDSTQKITINGNNQTINIDNQLNINSKNTIIIKNTTINARINNYNPDLTIQDSTLQKEINNHNTLALNNTKTNNNINNDKNLTIIGILNSTINNEGTLIIDQNTIIGENYEIYGNGKIYTNATQTINGNQTITNKNFKLGVTIPTTGNITLTNCQINAKITNQGNLTLQNCSLSNNNMTTSGSKTDGFLVENKGNMALIECMVENNTFTSNFTTSASELYYLYGAIFNKGLMDIINSSLSNNKVGESNSSRISAYGAVITNNGTLSLNNCICDSNNASASGSVIYDIGNYIYWDNDLFDYAYSNTNAITIDNSEFNNNFAGYHGGAIYAKNTRYTITNTNFTHNDVDNQYYGGIAIAGGVASTGGALHIGGIGIIENCEFKDNYIGILDGKIPYNSFRGGAIFIEGFGSSNITNTKFVNNTAETGATIFIGAGRGLFFNNVIDNCVFENNYLEDSETGNILQNMGYLNISNSEFKNNYDANNLIGLYGEDYTTNVLNTKFTDNKMTNSTISSTQKTGTIKNNTYTNTTINDILTLNTPNKIYTGEAITITGTYNINNLKCYDQDILEQNKFNIYINGELDQTVDTLEFTITPTDSNMILTVQPTISQTRKSAIIQASTLNFTLEPITATIGETAQITAQITLITDDTEMEVNDGRVYFKVNGKILRDVNTGRILYADVTDNTATLDYQVPKTWNEDTELEAVFTGNDEIPQKTSNTVNPTVTAPETSQSEFSVADTTATAGSEVTITVATKNLDAGKVVLKVNGKTVKADDGKLYAKVTADMTIFTYTVPKTYKTGDYTIKAVYTCGSTKLETEATLSLV